MTPTGKRNLLIACGQALYGERWQTDMSRELDINDRTLRRWVSGDIEVPSGIFIDCMRLMMERAQTLDELVEQCREAGAP